MRRATGEERVKIIGREALSRRASPIALGLLLVAAPLVVLHPSSAEAAPKKAAATASQKASPKTKGPAPKPRARASSRKPAPSATTTPAAATSASTNSPPGGAASAAHTSPAAVPGKNKPGEAPITSPEAQPPTTVVKTEEERDGEKTYTFGAQEVEGRLKSPQILYFLRRVRAQFDPAPLGHRSFMLELSDTRRHPAFE